MLPMMGDRLTALDATFLELEQMDEGATMHIGGVLVFDPLPDGTVPMLEAVRANVASRLTLLPRYCQRLSSERTGGLTWPQWQDDPLFDIDNHVHPDPYALATSPTLPGSASEDLERPTRRSIALLRLQS